MVRDTYEIPVRLSITHGEMTVSPTTNEGTVLPVIHDLTLQTMVFAVMSGFAFFAMYEYTGIKHGGPIGLPLFFLAYVWVSVLLVHQTPTGLNGWDMLGPMLHYAMGVHRNISTRATAPAKDLIELLGLRGITKDNGDVAQTGQKHSNLEYSLSKRINNSVCIFSDYTYGEVIELSGSASVLTFPRDQRMTIGDVDNFYQKMKPDINLTWDSENSPQRVSAQLAAKREQMRTTPFRNTNLYVDLKYQYWLLKNYVGHKFHAWHQYVVVRAITPQAISSFNFWMNMKSQKGLFVKKWRRLTSHEMFLYFKHIYNNDVSKNSQQ